MPPRSLKAPSGVWFSCLTQVSAPTRADSSGQWYCGVGGITACTRDAAASRRSSKKLSIGGTMRTPARPGKAAIVAGQSGALAPPFYRYRDQREYGEADQRDHDPGCEHAFEAHHLAAVEDLAEAGAEA